MQHWRIGDVTVTKIVELEMSGGMRFVLPQATPEAIIDLAWLRPHFMTDEGRMISSVHALVVETPDRRILVDTCVGNDKERMPLKNWHLLQTSFLGDLAEAGYARDSIDTVLCTHLHVDHVGWNTMLKDDRWVPTFERARYLMAETEFEYWRTQESDELERVVFSDSIAPVFDAGLVDLVETSHRICDEVDLVPTLGHTPGHVSVRIRSKGEEALITGDFLHHPCQFAHPEWAATPDYDQDASTATRRRMFDALADTPTLIIGTHFAGATAGRIVRDGDAYRLDV
ncbi:MAG: MBL fold metallo-hydrolase [Maricaulaceae bacterium]|jgi:glyoxylase-like metal-dependent hydrolase (beta-lactamase superfamily II)